MNVAPGLSLTEWDGILRRKLSGCRIVGFELTQEQNKPATLELDIEGATYAEDETSVSPSITLLSTTPFLMSSQLTVDVGGTPTPVISSKLAVKFKHTADDGLQPLGEASRSKIDLVQIDDIAFTIKRHLLADDSTESKSKWLAAFRNRTAYLANAMDWVGQMIIPTTGTLPWTLSFDVNAMRIESLADIKQSVVGGAMIEEVTFHAVKATAGDALMIVTCANASATPADQS
jgi:hypothetical protein